jgi:hypothetical protein
MLSPGMAGTSYGVLGDFFRQDLSVQTKWPLFHGF